MKLLLETLQGGCDYLAKKGIEDPRLNMEHLLAHVLGCRRLDLYLRFNETLHEPDLGPLRQLLRRRGEGEPLQHLLGSVEFCGHEFISDSRALVPRPETEYLVEELIRRFRSAPPATVLDVGAGSGCIGLSLAAVWPSAQVLLVDISEDALELTRLNATRIKLDANHVKTLRSDLFEKVTGAFDLITANLPYIPKAEIPTLSREVRRDPILALDGGASGLEIVDRFITECSAHLTPDGWIALELGHDQSAAVAEQLGALSFRSIEAFKDLAGIERFVVAQRPASSAPILS